MPYLLLSRTEDSLRSASFLQMSTRNASASASRFLWGKIFKHSLPDSSLANNAPQGEARNNMIDPSDSSLIEAVLTVAPCLCSYCVSQWTLLGLSPKPHMLPYHTMNMQWLPSFKSHLQPVIFSSRAERTPRIAETAVWTIFFTWTAAKIPPSNLHYLCDSGLFFNLKRF